MIRKEAQNDENFIQNTTIIVRILQPKWPIIQLQIQP